MGSGDTAISLIAHGGLQKRAIFFSGSRAFFAMSMIFYIFLQLGRTVSSTAE
jgi:hypothetical protein